MPVYDFSSGFNALNGGLSDLAKTIQDRRDGEMLAQALGQYGQGQAQVPAPVATAPAGRLSSLAPAPQAQTPTFATMDGTTPTAQFGGDKDAFARSVMPYALEASKQTGVDPRIIVAQAALESGWGKHAPGNNFFGIKGQGQNLATTEVVNGQPVRVNDSFRTFGSPADSFQGYASFINSNPRYQNLKTANGLDSQIAALAASGYATDPNYGTKIAAIAKGLPAPDGTQASPADLPVQSAQPAEFRIPGAGGGAGGGMTPQNLALIQNLVRHPGTRQAGLALWQQAIKGQDIKTVDLGGTIGIMDQRGNIVGEIPKTMTEADRQRIDLERSQGQVVGNALVGRDGRIIYQGQEKPQVVGNSLVRADGTVAYQGPKTKTEMVNGRLVYVDENGGTARDITPEGLPAGYRPMTDQERQQYGIPDGTGAVIGPDGKPAALAGTANTTVKLPPQENAYDSGQGTDYSKTFTDLQKTGRAAIGTKNTLSIMDRLTRDPNFYSGFGGDGKLKFNQLLASLGVKDPNTVAPTEAFGSLMNDVILGKLGGSLGTGVSNGDVTFMQNTGPTLTKTKEGNQLLIQFGMRMADRQQEIAKMARDYAKSHNGRIDMGFDDQLAQWAEQNKLFSEKDFQDAQAAAKGIPISDAPPSVRERPLPPKNERVAFPKEYPTPEAFLARARQVAQEGKKDKAALEEELWKRGIDPRLLDAPAGKGN